MQQDILNGFTRRVSQANHSELVVIMIEAEIEYLKEAQQVYEQGKAEDFVLVMKKAQKFQQELMYSIQCINTIALDVMSLFLFVNKNILASIIKRQPVELDACIKVMKNLLIGFEGLAKKDTDAPIMKNTQQVYAGLTYGRGYLNETCMDPLQRSRGFKA